MKKLFVIFMILLAALIVMCSCGGNVTIDEAENVVYLPDGAELVDNVRYYVQEDDTYLALVTSDTELTSFKIPAERRGKPIVEVWIENNVTNIPRSAFAESSNVKVLKLGSDLKEMDRGALSGCVNLESLSFYPLEDVSNNIGHFFAADSYIPASLKTISLAKGVSTIKRGVFTACTALTSLVIPDTVTYIDDYAFEGCTGLEYLTLPDSITSIGNYAFSSCQNLEDITLSKGLQSIGDGAFKNCTSLTSIKIPVSVNSIGYRTFENCDCLTVLCESKEQSVDIFRWEGSNYKCPVVWDCNNNDVADDGNIYTVISGVRYRIHYYDNPNKSVAVAAKQPNNITELIIPDSISYNGKSYDVTGIVSLADHPNIAHVTMGANVKNISDYMFKNCLNLESVAIGSGVEKIGEYAFESCTALTSLTVPKTVTDIGPCAFYNCTALIVYFEAEAPGNWNRDWGDTLFTTVWDCKNNDVANNGYAYTMYNGMRFAIKDGIATVARQRRNIITAEIPEQIVYDGVTYSVTGFDDLAFLMCKNLQSVTIPKSVVTLGQSIFSGCESLTQVNFAQGITDIGTRAFADCIWLSQIKIPDSVISIGAGAFANCTNLTNIVLGKNVADIGSSAFHSCTKLKNIKLPNSVTSIGEYAFYRCTAMESIVIPKGVSTIGKYAFQDCEKLTIYCVNSKKMSGWSNYWNNSLLPVVWGYEEE